jgi:predicted DNA-binding protein YlxM (UPF0122 family)
LGNILYKNEEWLRQKYIDEKYSLPEIAKICNVSKSTIHYWTNKFNIECRKPSDISLQKTYIDISYDELYNLYIIKKLPITKICKFYNCSYSVIYNRLKKFDIEINSRSILFCRDGNPNWKGGLSYQKYCYRFNIKFKDHIRNKFGRKCYICGTSENITKEQLCVHHIDYNKNAICNGKEWAFVPLCRSCHAKTNGNRWYWFNLLINYWLDKYEIPWVM